MVPLKGVEYHSCLTQVKTYRDPVELLSASLIKSLAELTSELVGLGRASSEWWKVPIDTITWSQTQKISNSN